MFQQHRLVFLQSKKEEDSANLVFNKQWLTGRMSFIYFNLPDWLKAWNPVTTSFGIMNFSRTNSKAWGVPQGDNIVRSYTASLLFADEAAFQPEFEEAYAAALPMAEKIVAVSTANPGYFAEIVTAK